MTDLPTLSIAERLGKVAFRNQGRADAQDHIEVDADSSHSTGQPQCTAYESPATRDTLDEANQVHFQFEDCIECGTCMYACDQGAVKWSYPDPELGRGVNWNLG